MSSRKLCSASLRAFLARFPGGLFRVPLEGLSIPPFLAGDGPGARRLLLVAYLGSLPSDPANMSL
eukprot:718479-Pyramimonas_sp.AAC.1